LITFLDGPASGQTLMLRRAPLFLRVCHDAGYAKAVCKKGRQEWDALDELSDVPRPGEKLYVYVRESHAGPIYVLMSSRNGSGWYERATYKLHSEQPDDETMRRTSSWQAWAQAAAEKMQADFPP
jgi:hypothetical protein